MSRPISPRVFPLKLVAPYAESMASEALDSPVPENIRQYVIVLYRRAPKRGRLGDEETVLHAHLAFLDEQRRLGRTPISGPFGDRGKLRGVSIYDSTSVEDVGRWVGDDPAVVQGWMTAEVRPWWGIAGSVLP